MQMTPTTSWSQRFAGACTILLSDIGASQYITDRQFACFLFIAKVRAGGVDRSNQEVALRAGPREEEGATTTLAAATNRALQQNSGSRAVSVIPELQAVQ